jgi:hypothetical protein
MAPEGDCPMWKEHLGYVLGGDDELIAFVSLYVVQALLGHSQPRMTQRYAHLAHQTLLVAAEVVPTAIGSATFAARNQA